MKKKALSLFLGSVGLTVSCTDPGSVPAGEPASTEAIQPVTAAVGLGVTPLAVDAQGIPHLLGGGATTPKLQAANATAAARMHVARLAPAWGVRSAKMPPLDAVGEIAVRGGTVVRFRQMIDGMPIESTAGGELRVLVRPDGSLVGASGRLMPSDMARGAARFVDDDAAAVARAVSDKHKTPFSAAALRAMAPTGVSSLAAGAPRMLSGQADTVNVSMSRARKAWYPTGKSLIPAWVVEAYSSDASSTDGEAYRTVISASGRIISRTNLKADVAFKYRVFAETDGEFHPFDGPIVDSAPNTTGAPGTLPFPAYVAPNLVTVEATNHPASGGPDSWLASNRTETLGNNVEAYADFNAPDGLTFGDYRAVATAAGTFDRTYDTSKGAADSQDQRMAGITQLFYIINWMHDFWYDGGFTEAAGNGQNSNYGRGGEDRDAMLAEAQDSSGRNNANMATPSDGFPGRMQVYVWDNRDNRKLTVAGVATASGSAAFGSAHFTTTANLVLANDGSATTTDACQPLTAPATGLIVVADRGTCSFKTKALNAQNAGAVGLIIADNRPNPIPPGLGEDASITTPITIGTLSVTQIDGTTIKTQIAAGTVSATMQRDLEPDLDGTLDATVIAHEFGHFVHHRLSSCNTTLCGAMSEGWADFSALLVTSRAGDDLDQAFPNGIYSTRGISPDPVWYGIRRAPYSTNHAINPLSFRHMATGEPLPPPPFNGGSPDNNAEVHNGGEVWASMLWQGYVALQKDGLAHGETFEQTRLKMRQYVVAGLLLAPPDATPTETRDAILMAVRTASQNDHDLLAKAFAERGFGSCAISPDRNSADFVGIVESTELKGRIVPGELAASPTKSCDSDQVLDGGESIEIKVPITNPAPVAMTDVKATLTSALSAVHITAPTVSLGKIDAYGSAMATFTVTLDDTLTAPTASDLSVQITSADGCGSVTVPLDTRFNTDDKPASSATDDFNAGDLAWKPSHVKQSSSDNDELWQHVRLAALDGLVLGVDQNGPSDASLTSPEIAVGTGDLTISFKHAYDFELAPAQGATPEQPFDGGVIEYSTDNGATWKDVSEVADLVYPKTLVGDPATSGNALSGRKAFSGTTADFPALAPVTLNFGNKLAGQKLLLRFRVGSDTNSGGVGWLIDDLAVTGATNTPFPTLVADAGQCATTPPDTNPDPHDDGGCCQAGGMGTGNLAAALGVLGLVLRRRRRRA